VTLEPVLRWFSNLDAWQAIPLFCAENMLLYIAAIFFGNRISHRWAHRRIVSEGSDNRRGEQGLGFLAIAMNTVVTFVGWWLWQRGTIHVTGAVSFSVVGELMVFVFALDALMYLGHRIGHHRLVYPIVHQLHHRYREPKAATLFALHPLEAIGFGSLWIITLVTTTALGYTASAAAIGGFTSMNLLFGLLGHVGVDPLPDRVRSLWLFRWVSTPSFHVGHHLNPLVNLGFFTTCWDRMFGTIDPTYDQARTSPLVPLDGVLVSA
jgi:Delta7-sterol 5-desaturase